MTVIMLIFFYFYIFSFFLVFNRDFYLIGQHWFYIYCSFKYVSKWWRHVTN